MGFIAHEVQEHFPNAVRGEKDGEDMQSVNYIEFVPLLVKELQDSKQRENNMQSRINELEQREKARETEFARLFSTVQQLQEKMNTLM